MTFLHSLKWRLSLASLLLMASASILLGILVYRQADTQFVANRAKQSRDTMFWLLTSTEPTGHTRVANLDVVSERLRSVPAPDYSYYLLDSASRLSRVLGQGNPTYVPLDDGIPDLAAKIAADKQVQFISAAGASRYRTLVYVIPLQNEEGSIIGAIQAETMLDEADTALEHLREWLLLVFGGISVAAFVFWTLLLQGTLKPFEALGQAADRVASGEFSTRVEVPQSIEPAGKTVRAFNKMLDTVNSHIEEEKRAQQRLREFLAEASHELRSPLTSLRGYVDVLRRGAKDDPEALARSLTAMHTNIGRATRLTNDLLLFSQLDLVSETRLTSLELASFFEENLEAARSTAGNRIIQFHPCGPCSIKGDPDLLSRLLWNLLDNAVRHTRDGGKISLSICRDGDRCRVVLADDGEGISAESLPHIFEPFYTAHRGQSQGVGLGLAIAQKIAHVHGGQISVDSSVGMGTTFTLTFPVSPS